MWREARQDQERSRHEGRGVKVRNVAAHLADHHSCEACPLRGIVGNRHADVLAGATARRYAHGAVAQTFVHRERREATDVAKAIGVMLSTFPPAKETFAAFERKGRRDQGRDDKHILTVWGGGAQCGVCLKGFEATSSRAARGPCSGLPAGVAALLRERRGHSLWAAATFDAAHPREGDVGQIIFCARCGRNVERGAPRALQHECPGQCGTRAAARALKRITGRQPRRPHERIELAIRRPWPIPLYTTASARSGAAATRAA